MQPGGLQQPRWPKQIKLHLGVVVFFLFCFYSRHGFVPEMLTYMAVFQITDRLARNISY